MPRLDVLLTGYDITDEIINRTSSTALALGHDTIRGTADIEIWTGAGGTGTQLALTTDYTVSDEDTDLSTEAGVSIYTKLAIVNGTYHNVDLYVTYKTIGDYASSTTIRSFDAEYTNVTGDYTVQAGDRYLRVSTASAITITIPDTMPDNWPLTFSRTVASANAVTVATSGAETVEGGASFVVIGSKAAAMLDLSEVSLRKVASAEWRFIGGIINGSDANGKYELYPSGRSKESGYAATNESDAVTNHTKDITFPKEFYNDGAPVNVQFTVRNQNYGTKISNNVTANATYAGCTLVFYLVDAQSRAFGWYWTAEGVWRAA